MPCIYQTACCLIPQDSSLLSTKFVLNIVLLIFFKAVAIGSIHNARVQRVHVDIVCPPRKIEGPHSCYRFSLLERKNSNSVVMIKVCGWVVECLMCMLYTCIGDINNLLLPNIYFMYRQVKHFKVLHGAYIEFMCSVKISEQIASFGLYSINRLFHVSEVESLMHSVN